MLLHSHHITDLSPHLFWDVEPGSVSFEKSKRIIVERVIQRGTYADLKLILDVYGKDAVRDTLKKVTGLNPRDIAFVHVYFDLPFSEIKCCTKRQYAPDY